MLHNSNSLKHPLINRWQYKKLKNTYVDVGSRRNCVRIPTKAIKNVAGGFRMDALIYKKLLTQHVDCGALWWQPPVLLKGEQERPEASI